ncbi:MAG: 2-isopropylmalate synthase [Deltaproteobacteria bacterium]|nr:2-isopropylmalate synthase [Deltaproteobacteria bacterium]
MKSITDRIIVYDTTLRDGEQSPGASMKPDEKLLLARQLEKLGVDVIEAGFPVSSPSDFAAVQAIAREVRGAQIAALSRAKHSDIDCAWEALKEAARPRLNLFLSTSDNHLKQQVQKSRAEVLEEAVAAVTHARAYTDHVECSAMDATRTERTFLKELFAAVIAAGARSVNIADTVGCAVPGEFGALVAYLLKETPGIERVVFSVHCHDDLGLAVANTLAAVEQGARQVKCTVNGIGERAGNASLEEVVMALATRRDYYGLGTAIRTEELCPTSRLLSRITGIAVAPNKAVVGANAFAHEAGIHQDGLLKDRTTYEIMAPQSVGAEEDGLVLGRHSGRRAIEEALRRRGHLLKAEELAEVVRRFKALGEIRKDLSADDLEEILFRDVRRKKEIYKLLHLSAYTDDAVLTMATVRMAVHGELQEEIYYSGSPAEAVLAAIRKLTGIEAPLLEYRSHSVWAPGGLTGEALVRLGREGRAVRGRARDADLVVASAKAYIQALNLLAWTKEEGMKHPEYKGGH